MKPSSGVVVARIYPPVTGQSQTLTVGRSAYFSLHWLLRAWRNLHLIWSFLRSKVSVDFFELLPTEFAACSKPPSRDNHRKASYPRTQGRDQGRRVASGEGRGAMPPRFFSCLLPRYFLSWCCWAEKTLEFAILARKSLRISAKTFFFLEITCFWSENLRFRPEKAFGFRRKPLPLWFKFCPPPPISRSWRRPWNRVRAEPRSCDKGSTRTLVTLLRPWIRRFTMIKTTPLSIRSRCGLSVAAWLEDQNVAAASSSNLLRKDASQVKSVFYVFVCWSVVVDIWFTNVGIWVDEPQS